MAYIGNPPAEAYTNTVKDTFSGDGSTVAFTLSRPSLTNDVRVVVENVIQDPTVAYGVSGTTLTFTSAPPSGTNNIYVVHLGPAVQTTVPPSEISTDTTFAGNVTVQGAFTSQGIDDNASSTAMTIDSSGNVLVGKTSTSFSTAGSGILSTGEGQFVRSGNPPVNVNRLSSDGSIIGLYKDGTAVGGIGYISSGLYIDGESGHAGLRFGGADISPRDGGADADAAIQLGSSSNRFTDLYLSGGVYLGGTGAANYLDDYEEGTWTPTFGGTSVNPSVSYTSQLGYYRKVGDLVNIFGFMNWSSQSGGSGKFQLTNFPFTQGSNRYAQVVTSDHSGFTYSSSGTSMGGYLAAGNTVGRLQSQASGRGTVDQDLSDVASSGYVYFSVTYQT